MGQEFVRYSFKISIGTITMWVQLANHRNRMLALRDRFFIFRFATVTLPLQVRADSDMATEKVTSKNSNERVGHHFLLPSRRDFSLRSGLLQMTKWREKEKNTSQSKRICTAALAVFSVISKRSPHSKCAPLLRQITDLIMFYLIRESCQGC